MSDAKEEWKVLWKEWKGRECCVARTRASVVVDVGTGLRASTKWDSGREARSDCRGALWPRT